MRRTRHLSLLLAAGLATAAYAWQVGTVNQFQHNGKTVSTDLRVVDGKLMVSAKDVAAYLGGSLSVANGTATVTSNRTGDVSVNNPGSGSSQPIMETPPRPEAKKLTVGIGEKADNDGFAITVAGLDEPKGAYRTVYNPRDRRIDASMPGDRLVVVRMRIENGTQETRRPPVPTAYGLTLFDDQKVGVPLVGFDFRPVQNEYLDFANRLDDTLDVPLLAPGGIFEFAAIFSLPKERLATQLSLELSATAEDKGGAIVNVRLR